MRMQYIRLPFLAQRIDCLGKQRDFAPFAPHRRAIGLPARAVEQQAIGLLAIRRAIRSRGHVAQAGNAAHLDTQRLLGLQDATGAERIAAVQRQRMVEDVQNLCHGPNR